MQNSTNLSTGIGQVLYCYNEGLAAPNTRAQVESIKWLERRTLAGAALRLRGPKPSDGLAAAAKGGESRTLAHGGRGAGGERKEAEDMGGAGWRRRHGRRLRGGRPPPASRSDSPRRHSFARRRGGQHG
jgi:hypothetical protein